MKANKHMSSYKYLFEIYISSDCKLHCERYPIIYIDAQGAYIKKLRKLRKYNDNYSSNKVLTLISLSTIEEFTLSISDDNSYTRLYDIINKHITGVKDELNLALSTRRNIKTLLPDWYNTRTYIISENKYNVLEGFIKFKATKLVNHSEIDKSMELLTSTLKTLKMKDKTLIEPVKISNMLYKINHMYKEQNKKGD